MGGPKIIIWFVFLWKIVEAISWKEKRKSFAISCYHLLSSCYQSCYHVNTSRNRVVIKNKQRYYQMLSVVIKLLPWIGLNCLVQNSILGIQKEHIFDIDAELLLVKGWINWQFKMQGLNLFFTSKDVWSIFPTLVLSFVYPARASAKGTSRGVCLEEFASRVSPHGSSSLLNLGSVLGKDLLNTTFLPVQFKE